MWVAHLAHLPFCLLRPTNCHHSPCGSQGHHLVLTHVGRHFVIWGHWRGAHHCQNGNAQITLLGLLVGGAAVANRSLAWWALAPARSASSIGAGLVVVCLDRPKPVRPEPAWATGLPLRAVRRALVCCCSVIEWVLCARQKFHRNGQRVTGDTARLRWGRQVH